MDMELFSDTGSDNDIFFAADFGRANQGFAAEEPGGEADEALKTPDGAVGENTVPPSGLTMEDIENMSIGELRSLGRRLVRKLPPALKSRRRTRLNASYQKKSREKRKSIETRVSAMEERFEGVEHTQKKVLVELEGLKTLLARLVEIRRNERQISDVP